MTATPVSCFGKLPIHGDFIRHDASGRGFDTLDRWFQAGLRGVAEAFGTGWTQGFDDAPPSRFILCPQGSPQFLVGVWVPGKDKTGRRFPFAAFLTLERAHFEGAISLLPGVFADFLDSAEDLATRGWTGLNVLQLKTQVAELEPGVDIEGFRSRYDDFVRRQNASVFWKGLFGASDDARKYLLIDKLHRVLEENRALEAPGAAKGLRCPLPSTLGWGGGGYEVTFCMDLGIQLFGGRGIPSLAYWDRRSRRSRLCMFFGETSPHWMIPVIRPELPSDHLVDLAGGDVGQAELLRGKYASTVGRPDLTLAGLLLEVAVLRSS